MIGGKLRRATPPAAFHRYAATFKDQARRGVLSALSVIEPRYSYLTDHARRSGTRHQETRGHLRIPATLPSEFQFRSPSTTQNRAQAINLIEDTNTMHGCRALCRSCGRPAHVHEVPAIVVTPPQTSSHTLRPPTSA
jgi:hypothetical protein